MAMAMDQHQPPAITIPPVPSQTYLHHTTLQPRPKLILIGDSITEQGSSHAHGWVTSLSIRYNRRLDVINRGMNGYNSKWGLAALPLILEEILGPAVSIIDGDDECIAKDTEDDEQKQKECTRDAQQQTSATLKEQVHPQYTFIIGYGANDSALFNGAHSRHHIPIQECTSNLKQMTKTVQTWNTKNVAVALLTPPPCDTTIQSKSRDNEHVTRLYAEACKQVATEMNVPVIDLWNGMQLPIVKDSKEDDVDIALFKNNEQWKVDYLSDGLHLTTMGNYRLYELVVEILDQSIGLSVTKLPRSYPDHSTIDDEPAKTFGNKINTD